LETGSHNCAHFVIASVCGIPSLVAMNTVPSVLLWCPVLTQHVFLSPRNL